MDEFIENLKTRELRKILKSRGLSDHYRVKAELVFRLKASLSAEETEKSLRDILISDEEDEFEDSIEMATNFVFKDVEDSLEKFTGETTQTVTEWVTNFENIATTCGWNDIQKYLFARKLLQGAARKAMEADKAVIDYGKLVALLKKEFETELTSYEIHRKLMFKKKSSSESYLEYFYDMRKIGPKLDEVSMVRYIVDGLPGDQNGKSILYDAKTLDELKSKLKVYGTMHNRSSNSENCKNCGSKDHAKGNCPDQQKGKKCFKCSKFGHVARDCIEIKSLGVTTKPVNCIKKDVGSTDNNLPLLKLKPVGLGQFKLVEGDDRN